MMQVYRKKLLIGLIVLLLLFAGIFILALYNIKRGTFTVGIGIPHQVENVLVMVLSLVSIIKVIHAMHTIDKQ